MKEDVEEFWHSPPDRRSDLSSPYIIYDVHKDDVTSRRTDFTITLKGSKTLLERAVSFQVPCVSEPPIPPQQSIEIKITREMYKSDPCYCPILEGLSGTDDDRSRIFLRMDDINCCTFLCEISFHLYRWEALGLCLGLEKKDIDTINQEQQGLKVFVKAFEMLAKWLASSEYIPTLGTLINGLHSTGFEILPLLLWTTSYNSVIPKTMDPIFISHLAKRISCHWKFVARLLGVSETSIHGAVQCNQSNLDEQACMMLNEWKRHCPLGNREAYLELFNSVHCVCEHLPTDTYFKNALSYLE